MSFGVLRVLGSQETGMNFAMILPLVLAALVAGGGGCESSSDDVLPCADDGRAEDYVAGMSETGTAGYTLTLMDSNPGPPALGDNRWSIEITDPAGNTAPGLELEVSTLMVDHEHRSPIRPTILDNGEGRYVVDPVNLFMPGYWEVTFDVVDPGETAAQSDDVALDAVVLKICVDA